MSVSSCRAKVEGESGGFNSCTRSGGGESTGWDTRVEVLEDTSLVATWLDAGWREAQLLSGGGGQAPFPRHLSEGVHNKSETCCTHRYNRNRRVGAGFQPS